MKKIILSTIFLVFGLYALAQTSYDVALEPDKPEKLEVKIKPANGYSTKKEIPLPVELIWDDSGNKIKLTVGEDKTEKAKDEIWFIYGSESITFGDFKKQEKSVWYSKEMKKLKRKSADHNKKVIVKSLGTMENIKLDKTPEGRKTDNIKLSAQKEFDFTLTDVNKSSCKLEISLYYATSLRKHFSSRDVRFEYLTEPLIFNITLKNEKDSDTVETDDDTDEIINKINNSTQSLEKLLSDIKKLNRADCRQIEKKKRDADTHHIKAAEYEDHKNYEEIARYIEKNDKVYKSIRSENCTVSPSSCIHPNFDSMNNQLLNLSEEIDKAVAEKRSLDDLRARYDKIKINEDTEKKLCTQCKNKESYKAYKIWCETIDNLLK